MATLLQYNWQPTQVQANTRASFTLEIKNGSQARNLTRNDEITLLVPSGDAAGDLFVNLNDIAPGAPAKWRFSKDPNGDGYNFIISPTENLTLAANASLIFSLSNAVINPLAGNCTLKLQEFIGDDVGDSSFSVSKTEAQFSIVAQAIPDKVGKNQNTQLRWTATKASYVTISPLSGQYDTQGTLSTNPSTDVTPSTPQVTYTFTAWQQSGQEWRRDTVTVTISPPVILLFEPQDHAPINYDDSITLRWEVAYAETVWLTLKNGPVQVKGKGEMPVKPRDMLPANSNASSVSYTLRATGSGPAVTSTLTVPFRPLYINYFRYPNFDQTSSVIVSVSNGSASYRSQQNAEGQTYYILTATGPFGPLTQYLGPYPALQVQVFVSSADRVAPGSTVTLSWQTWLATRLELDDGSQIVPLPDADVAHGQHSVTIYSSTNYLLIAYDAQGRRLTSSLLVTVA